MLLRGARRGGKDEAKESPSSPRGQPFLPFFSSSLPACPAGVLHAILPSFCFMSLLLFLKHMQQRKMF